MSNALFTTSSSVAILGGGPVGLTLALLLARRRVPSVVFDACSIKDASTDRRLLALSLGSLQTLQGLAHLPEVALAPIRAVTVSSVGQFGRAVIGEGDLGAKMLGATIRYGTLMTALSAAAESNKSITVRRPLKISAVHQTPSSVQVELEGGGMFDASLALNAEGFGNGPVAPHSHTALVADLDVTGVEPGHAFERFTRDGPLALLPLPAQASAAATRMGLVWCMTNAQADRRGQLSDTELIEELGAQLGEPKLRVPRIATRGRFPLHQQARDDLVEHRIVYLGNAAQTLHPVAGQGLNLGLRDSVALADRIGAAQAAGTDPIYVLRSYASSRRADRAAIVALTRTAPAFFATRFAPIALARSIGLTALAVVPKLRREFARLLMFGVRW